MTRRCKSGSNMKEGKEQLKLNQLNRIMVVEKDIIRYLIIPRKEAERPATTYITESHFDRIKKNSRSVPDLREKQDQEKNCFDEEKRRYEALNREVQQLKQKKAQEITEEERKEREKILARSEQLRREEEDIIKQCNSLILSAKCKAIQDAQIIEKQRIRQQLKQQEESLDSKIESEHKQALHALQKKREEDWAKRREYAKSILNQIQYNEDKQLQYMKMMQKENKVLRLKAQQQNDEDRQCSAREMEKRIQMKKQNERINEEIKRNKERERELEKLENLKIQEYMKRKLQEEKEREKQKLREKQLEERELARLWKLQKCSQSLLESKDEIIYERLQEQQQRKWRQKELEKIRKRMREIENINRIRERQIEEKRTSLICTSVEKKEEAHKIAAENQKLRDELMSLQTKQKQITEKYKKALREQINEKEQKRQKQRQQILKEGEDLLEQIQKHDHVVKETMKKKMDQIRSSNIPEIYVQGIEKKMHLS